MTLVVTRQLDRLFSPRSIALIGASRDRASISGQPLGNLRDHGYRGTIYPVNPRYEEVDGLECYPSVAALPAPPDLAVFLISAKQVPSVLRECGERGVPYALIISSGFAETDAEGTQLQKQVVEIARAYGIGVVGPNCQGMMNVTEGMFAGFGAAFQIPRIRSGPVSLVTQSGGFGYAVVSMAEEAGVGFRHVVCTGNEAGISTLDLMESFITDRQTQIIAGYVEGLKDARRLLDVGDGALAAGKPIMIWKVGVSEAGRQAAISHTANFGGAAELYKAVFRQRGILEVQDVQDLADFSRAFLYGRYPRGARAAVVTLSGGAGVVTADVCAQLGIATPAISADSEQRLRAIIPAFGSVRNPIDVTGNIFNDRTLLRQVLQIVAEDPNVDSLIIITALVQGDMAVRFASDLVALNGSIAKPVILCWSARESLAAEAYALIDAASIPRYPTPVRAARALGALITFAEARRRHAARAAAPPAAAPAVDASAISMACSGRLTEHRAKAMLADYGIRVTRERIATSSASALSIAAEIGYPVALKISSPDIPHKTEARAVRVGLRTPEQVASAYEEITSNARSFEPTARLDGVLVQEMISGGVETIAGVVNDERFGPAIMFGLGGVFTEVLRDFVFRICPISRDDARDMIEELKSFAVLKGVRGAPPLDISALTETLMKLSGLAMDCRDTLAELDINPLVVFPEGRGVTVVDAFMSLSPHAPVTATAHGMQGRRDLEPAGT